MLKTNQKFSWRKRINSFKYAWEGLCQFIRQEHNARIHSAATVLVVIAGWYLDIDRSEWLAVIMCIGLVWTVEMLNTALENLCDYVSPAYDPKIKTIKDLAAAAVLISAITSVIIGGYIFIPKLWMLFNKG